MQKLNRYITLFLLVVSIGVFGVSIATDAQSTANSDIPAAAWSRPIGLPHDDPGHSRVDNPPWYMIIDDGPFNGAPLGGLGAGSIGRSYRGDFSRWHLDIGAHYYEPIPANQFSVYMAQGEEQIAQALWTAAPEDDRLSAWQWNYPVGAGTYSALYPRSWFTYETEQFPVALTVEQFSPVIPNNYQESSYPVAVFNWTATNPTDEVVTVGIMFTWQNMLGHFFGQDTRGGQINQLFEIATADGMVRGVQMTNTRAQANDEWGGSMAIAALEVPGVTVSYQSRFLANGDGADIWTDFAADGALANADDATPSERREILGGGVAVTFTIQPGETLVAPFALAWDMPVMTFGDGVSWYKRYTAFYGRDGDNAAQMTQDALLNRDDWRAQIIDWQAPILASAERPLWYQTALFNELYFLVDGQTIWEHGRLDEPEPSADYLGRFMYIESVDYLHYATFDVDFYASFALLQLFPELERRLMLDYAATIPLEDTRPHLIGATGEIVPRKLAGSVPHDLGGPTENPWLEPNNYTWQNINVWKDLAPKFVLRLYRDALFLEDESLIIDNWDEVQMAMAYLAAMDRDGDGIPENEGIPDQTYDTWPVTGISAYSGGLWLAALAACEEMALIVGDSTAAADYAQRLEQATTVYEAALWNGAYYDYDQSNSPYYDSIMADQLAGQWYGDFLGLELLPPEQVETTLQTIYQFNVLQYGDGDMGAVNGMRPDGRIDTSDMQSQEMWTGTTYALASLMLLRGLDEEAWATAHGVYNVTYVTKGMWFRTPEAFDVDGNYRASVYQRPLAIWAIELALAQRSR